MQLDLLVNPAGISGLPLYVEAGIGKRLLLKGKP